MARDADALSARIRNAGAIFLGEHTPEAIGDYVGGSNHVLPTARSARFSSGLGVHDFLKRTSVLRCDAARARGLRTGGGRARRGRGPRRACAIGRAAARARGAEVTADGAAARRRLYAVSLDESSIDRGSPDQEHERTIAIYDLVEENSFAVPGRDDGPYALRVGLQDARLALEVKTQAGEQVLSFGLSLTPLRSILKDYFLICESYYAAIRTASPRSDRGDRPQPQRAAQRGRGARRPKARREGRGGCGHGAAAVHADLGAALEGMTGAILDRRAFIIAHTRVLPAPLAPDIALHVADEATELWQKTEDELGEIGLPPPFWAFAWAGGQGLARYVLDHCELVAGKRVLDFASGSGLVAIAAAMAGAAAVEASEIDEFALTAIALNSARNGVSIEARGGDLIGADEGWDVVLAGDVSYQRDMAEAATGWLAALARRGATRAHRRSLAQLSRARRPRADRAIQRAGDASARGCGHQADRRVPVSRKPGGLAQFRGQRGFLPITSATSPSSGCRRSHCPRSDCPNRRSSRRRWKRRFRRRCRRCSSG